MKVICQRDELENALNIVNKAINSSNTLPVLNNILIKAEGKKLFFAATNLEIAIQYHMDADVRNEGAITVPAKLITPYVSLLREDMVEMSLGGGVTLELSSKTSKTKIKGISADEFPLIPKVEKENVLTISTKDLEKSINQTVFAASVNTTRPVLSGVLFKVDKDTIKLVATDSYRLAEKTLKLKSPVKFSVDSLIPARTVSELGKLLAKCAGKEVEINFSKNQVLIKMDGIELTSRLIEGKFPDYEKIIPKESKTKTEISVEELALVVKRVSLFARENNNNIKLTVTNDGVLQVATDETRVGEEKAEISVKVDGDNNKIALNSQYLLDVLMFVSEEKINLGISDKLSPATIAPLKGGDYVYIIMPLKI
ncbi:MAG: DNA polymerase III subunit beta [Patescibacteria group bacterium]